MKNTLTDLNNYLFEALECLNDPELTGRELDEELKKSEAKCKVGTLIIANAGMLLRAAVAADTLVETKLPAILEG